MLRADPGCSQNLAQPQVLNSRRTRAMLADRIDNQSSGVRLQPKAWNFASDQDQQGTGIQQGLEFGVALDHDMLTRALQNPHGE
jgi:hypothetical protein